MTEEEALLTPAEVGARIKQLRKGKHLTQTQVASVAMVSRQFIGALENGHPRAELAMVMRVGAAVGLKIG